MRNLGLIAITVAATAAIFMGGLALAQTAGEPTVATQTFENVVTYTIPTETVVETVTVTVSTETEPPTTTEPPPGGACTVDDTSGCEPASEILIRDSKWLCDRPLSSYGPLPLLVRFEWSPGFVLGANGAVDLFTGCTGDGDPDSIDLIVDVPGTLNEGAGNDAVKTRVGPHDIQLTGHADCGPRVGGAHQDGVQLQGGRNIDFVDFTIGDYQAGLSSCQGALGAMAYSAASGNQPVNVNVVRGAYIACNHSLGGGVEGSSGTVSDASFRSGRVDGSDPKCIGFAASNPCAVGPMIATERLVCERWRNGGWEDQG